jgi:GlpG protein
MHFILFICAGLFIWNNIQEEYIKRNKGILAAYLLHTPLEKQLLFDYPDSFQRIDRIIDNFSMKDLEEIKEIPISLKETLERAQGAPSWKGLYPFFILVKKEGFKQASQIPLFTKIRQGEIWRLFTPCLLHADFLHILFNMAWLWILGKQIEAKIKWLKMGLLILIVGVISNTAQYLMSGPSFLGFSGVIVGMATFIWMRQRRAPWEGYTLSKATFLFLLLFVLAMSVLGFITFTLNAFSLLDITPVIANTAHIVGGLCGFFLGCFSFFARSKAL